MKEFPLKWVILTWVNPRLSHFVKNVGMPELGLAAPGRIVDMLAIKALHDEVADGFWGERRHSSKLEYPGLEYVPEREARLAGGNLAFAGRGVAGGEGKVTRLLYLIIPFQISIYDSQQKLQAYYSSRPLPNLEPGPTDDT